MISIRKLGVMAAASGLVVLMPSSAMATSWSVSAGGAYATFNNDVGTANNERFNICDTDADGDYVYVNYEYNNGPKTRIEWHGGNGTCSGSTYTYAWPEGKDVNFQVCREINNWPDDCSSWKDAGT